MSTTDITTTQPAPAAPRPWYRRWYAWAALAALAGGAAAGALIGTMGGGPGHAPADILARDGYGSVVAVSDPARIAALAGGDTDTKTMLTYVERAAAGYRDGKARMEVVLELTPAGAKLIGPMTGLLAPAAKAEGLDYRFTDNDLVMAGPAAAFSNLDSGSAAPAPASPAPAPASPAAPAQAASPVDILKQAGATPAPGTQVGSHDVWGNRMADGTFGGQYGEQITVYTADTDAAFSAAQDRAGQSDDAKAVITIPASRAVLVVTPTLGAGGGYEWAVSPTEIAKRVGGLNILSPDQAASYDATATA